MATQYCFIAGTDTGAGKTWVTVQLIQHYQNQGKSVLAYKPIASGIDAASNMNEDVFLLKQSMAHAITNQRMNPFLFEQPIAPHIANEQRKLDLSVASLSAWWQAECQTHSQVDLVLIEGCGG